MKQMLLISSLGLLIVATPSAAQDGWKRVGEGLPPVYATPAVVFDESIVWGAYCSEDGRTFAWQDLQGGIEIRTNHAMAAYDSKAWILGGGADLEQSPGNNEVWSSSNKTHWMESVMLTDGYCVVVGV